MENKNWSTGHPELSTMFYSTQCATCIIGWSTESIPSTTSHSTEPNEKLHEGTGSFWKWFSASEGEIWRLNWMLSKSLNLYCTGNLWIDVWHHIQVKTGGSGICRLGCNSFSCTKLSQQSENYSELVDNILAAYQQLSCQISMKVHFLSSSGFFFTNLGDVSYKHDEWFHQYICTVGRRYRGHCSPTMMGDYCWFLQWSTAAHTGTMACVWHLWTVYVYGGKTWVKFLFSISYCFYTFYHLRFEPEFSVFTVFLWQLYCVYNLIYEPKKNSDVVEKILQIWNPQIPHTWFSRGHTKYTK